MIDFTILLYNFEEGESHVDVYLPCLLLLFISLVFIKPWWEVGHIVAADFNP